MAIDLSLTIVPPQVDDLVAKARERQGTEYADLLFFLPTALLGKYNDFGDPTWQAFGADAGAMPTHYPQHHFPAEYHLPLSRVSWGLDYLVNGGAEGSFFRDGRVYDFIRSGQGHPYILWDHDCVAQKHDQLETWTPGKLLAALDPHKMDKEVPKFHDTDQYRQQLMTTLLTVRQLLATARQEGLWVAVQYT